MAIIRTFCRIVNSAVEVGQGFNILAKCYRDKTHKWPSVACQKKGKEERKGTNRGGAQFAENWP